MSTHPSVLQNAALIGTEAPINSSAAQPRSKSQLASRLSGGGANTLLFLTIFLMPLTLIVAFFGIFASEQFRVETQFAVRGADSSPLNKFGLGALPGMSGQQSDSYIITDYLESEQIIEDINTNQGVDLRLFYAKDGIDILHQIDPNLAREHFLSHWKWHTNASYNSVTGNTSFEAYAFTREDAHTITTLVLKEASRLVNDLSSTSRQTLIRSAREEVTRTEVRLARIRKELLIFRNREQALDPKEIATLEATVIQSLTENLTALQTRRKVLGAAVTEGSPTLRIIDRQIRAIRQQIAEKKTNIGTGAENSNVENLSAVFNDYSALILSEEFATQAYKIAQTALESAQTDARKQQRYLAVYVNPMMPTASLYPKPFLYSFIAGFWLLILWLIVLFISQSVRDHVY